jgi:hypothetical protein
MRTGNNMKTSKHGNKKDFSMKTQRAVRLNPAATGGIAPGRAEANSADAISAMTQVTSEEKRRLIAEAAYYRAEHRSFAPGNEMEDWLSAETEIETILSKDV